MSLRQRATMAVERLRKDDVRRLILHELMEVPQELQYLGRTEGPFGRLSGVWLYAVDDYRNGGQIKKAVWVNSSATLIRRYTKKEP